MRNHGSLDGLEPGERVIASVPLRLRRAFHLAAPQAGPARLSALELLTVGTLGARRRSRHDRLRAAAASGVPIGKADVVLGVTDRHRILVWRAHGLGLRPGHLQDEIEPGTLTQAAIGTGLRPVLSLATSTDVVLEAAPLRRRNLAATVQALNAAIAGRR